MGSTCQERALMLSASTPRMHSARAMEAKVECPVELELHSATLTPYKKLADDGTLTKERMLRILDRKVRFMGSLPAGETFRWYVWATWKTFLLQLMLATFNVYMNSVHHWNLHDDALHLPAGYRPYLLATLNFIAAFLTGLRLNDSVNRYKLAMSALHDMKNSVEGLRTNLCASTIDPKIQTSVQVFIAFMAALIQKSIVYHTEKYDVSILQPVPVAWRESVFFKSEALWAFSRRHWEYLFFTFLQEAKVFDKEGNMWNLYSELRRSWTRIEDMLVVRTPGTSHHLTQAAVQIFFLVIPLFNEDWVTQFMVPFVATIFMAMLQLSSELADPFDDTVTHGVPLAETMQYLSMPLPLEDWSNDEQSTIQWLNEGLRMGMWENKDPEHPIPRVKTIQPHKGETIDFVDMKTIAACFNYKNDEAFLRATRDDLDGAKLRGRKMALYLDDLKWLLGNETGPETA